ncbi:MAG: hypothetical protein CBD52_000345 [Euryarchaeota archaeon TMED192]|nr:MAG: hypothetical protein CBD52_000345 [Euryarchaeota archaeon TMED192]|tara:strand:- start:307 stop:2646 length:2340 start_codon:yes stop_codon:yes gene_type:complete
MSTRAAAFLVTFLLFPVVVADTPIDSSQQDIFTHPFDENVWTLSATSGFAGDEAQYTDTSINSGTLQFTHQRPRNYQSHISYASNSETGATLATGVPDGDYSWSKGPDIIVSGFDFQGLETRDIIEVTLRLHISIPDPMPSDEVMIVVDDGSSVTLVSTIARTTGPIDRFTIPLNYGLGNGSVWDWAMLSAASVKIDYVSDGAPDDSEIQVDAVALEVSFFQPWYGFENAKAVATITPSSHPIMDFDVNSGSIAGLEISPCGLQPSGNSPGEWSILTVIPPFEQSLGRIHIISEEGLDATLAIRTPGSQWTTWSEGALLPQALSLDIMLVIRDGCVGGLRVDINDPTLYVTGTVDGNMSGIVPESSHIRFAIGTNLALEVPFLNGPFSYEIPVGDLLPSSGGDLLLGIGTRFQWSSDGEEESVTMIIESMTISGGYSIDIDTSPTCLTPSNQYLVEDEGGITVPILSACSDDRDPYSQLEITATSRIDELLDLTISGGDLQIQPFQDSSGSSMVDITVSDSADNYWSGSFLVDIQPVADPPSVQGLPSTITVELGETLRIPLTITDPDTEELTITTSRSWANIDDSHLVLTPVVPGSSLLVITVGDGIAYIDIEIDVIVRALPLLMIDDVSSFNDDLNEELPPGTLIDLSTTVWNQGEGAAFDIDVSCHVDGILYQNIRIPLIEPNSPAQVTCAIPAPTEQGEFTISVEIESKNQVIDPSSSLQYSIVAAVEGPIDESGILSTILSGNNTSIALLIVLFSTLCGAALYLGPNKVRKPYR